MVNYQPNPQGEGWLIRFDNDTYLILDTEGECVDMATKVTLATQAQTLATRFAGTGNDMNDLYNSYFDRGYNVGGANPITDEDLSGLNINATDLGSFISLCEQVQHFLNNAAVAQGDYSATLNKIRTDV